MTAEEIAWADALAVADQDDMLIDEKPRPTPQTNMTKHISNITAEEEKFPEPDEDDEWPDEEESMENQTENDNEEGWDLVPDSDMNATPAIDMKKVISYNTQ